MLGIVGLDQNDSAWVMRSPPERKDRHTDMLILVNTHVSIVLVKIVALRGEWKDSSSPWMREELSGQRCRGWIGDGCLCRTGVMASFCQECIIFCVREEPVVFLRAEEDFVSYTPRDKESLHENLRDPSPGVKAENLELAIQKEVRACEWRPNESTSS